MISPDQLREEVEAELALIRQTVDELAAIASEYGFDDAPGLRTRAAAGALLHSFYNGVEAILKRFARYHEVPLPEGERYHVQLLDLFKEAGEAPSSGLPLLVRGALGEEMDRFRSFRHLFRQAYSFQLEGSRFAPGVAAAQGVFGAFEQRVRDALPKLDGAP